MPSPFPGMDPYLENPAVWEDFHGAFIYTLRERLLQTLPPGYDARVSQQVYLVEPPQARLVKAGVGVTNGPGFSASLPSAAPAGVLTVVPVPLVLESFMEVTERYIEIFHEPERSLVAVVEVLSPANKEQPGHGEYLGKRERLLRQDIHLVELDLLRAGHRLPIRGQLPAGDYFAHVARAEERPIVQVYGWSLRQPLPALPIPLRGPDPDVWIDLQTTFTLTFDRNGFQRRLPYTQAPPGPLSGGDLAWARERADAGIR